MNLKCILGSHEWRGCRCLECDKIRDEAHIWDGCRCVNVRWGCEATRDQGHKWNGCQCTVCGKARNEGHDWKDDCGKCARCGRIRPEAHQWNGCKCAACGKVRDESHDWSRDCEECSVCGQTREDHHQWVDGRCQACGAAQAMVDLFRAMGDGYFAPLKKTLNKSGRDVPIDRLLPLLGGPGRMSDHTVHIVSRSISLTAAKAILYLGGYEHADVLQRMVGRDLPHTGDHIFKYLRQAVEFKLEGFDFKVEYQKAGYGEIQGEDGSSGKTGFIPAKLAIIRGDELPK